MCLLPRVGFAVDKLSVKHYYSRFNMAVDMTHDMHGWVSLFWEICSCSASA